MCFPCRIIVDKSCALLSKLLNFTSRQGPAGLLEVCNNVRQSNVNQSSNSSVTKTWQTAHWFIIIIIIIKFQLPTLKASTFIIIRK